MLSKSNEKLAPDFNMEEDIPQKLLNGNPIFCLLLFSRLLNTLHSRITEINAVIIL